MDNRSVMRLCSLVLCLLTPQVWCQLCPGPCQCPPTVPRCPPGIQVAWDSCGCCQVCARQRGDSCSDRMPCDAQQGLKCDYSASFPGDPGLCVGRDELGCEMNGVLLEEGQLFQPSCSQRCRCLGGGLTCVNLCSDDLQVPDNCPNPRLVRLPGRCCREWRCGGADNGIPSNLASAEQVRQDYSGGLSSPISNCIELTTAWSPCSHSCGPGVSTRSSNRNWACRLQTETRLCHVRPCQAAPPGLQRLQMRSGMCESHYISPVPVKLEHRGCWSIRAYRPKFCTPTCPDGSCCIPSHTKVVRIVFRCPQGEFILQQAVMVQSCSCSISNCRPPPARATRSPLPRM